MFNLIFGWVFGFIMGAIAASIASRDYERWKKSSRNFKP